MTAFRVARGFTGKTKIVKFEGHYHGWSDEEKVTIDASSVAELGPVDNIAKLINTKGQRTASVDDVIVAPWNDLPRLEAILKRDGDQIACVCMEPFMYDSGPIRPLKGYLQGVKDLCERYKVLLFFDEVITGFRMALGGAQQYFGVTPHIATFGKAVAGGLPLSLIAGRRDIMDCGVHASGTFNANAASVAAALACIAELEKPGTYEHFQELGDLFCDGLRTLGQKHGIDLFCDSSNSIIMLQLGVQGEATTFRDFLDRADVPRYQKLFSTLTRYGVRITSKRGRIYLSTEHSREDIQRTLDAFDVVFAQI